VNKMGFDRFVCERENLVLDFLIYLQLVKRFLNRSEVMKFRCFCDSSSGRVQDKLKAIRLNSR